MTKTHKALIVSGLVLCIVVLVAMTWLLWAKFTDSAPAASTDSAQAGMGGAYEPRIDPSEFTSRITNPYFPLPVGMNMVYEAQTEDGIERIEIMVPGWTKMVMGVETLVFWDRVYLDGKLIEDTRDYVAQDKEGNVWYFGEDVDNYAGGKFVDHGGAWIGGIDGAKPGIWMKANPKVGDEYRQEYYRGEAEDMGRVDGVGYKVTTPAGSFTDCVKVFEWTPLESATAYKYHCAGVGTVLEEEEEEQVKLIEVDANGALCMRLPDAYAEEGILPGAAAQCAGLSDTGVAEVREELVTEITEDDAERIALARVPGEVTDVAIEEKFGRLSFVVEIDADSGPETDVIIDISTGEVLGVEE